jgi:AraC-like DNA-binding protein
LHDSDPAAATALAAHGRGLMASALLLSDERTPHDAASSLATARGYLRMKHSDPDLTIDHVARACLVSRRTLYRLFESVPGGVGGLLRHIRVEHAQALLRADPSRSLTSVATGLRLRRRAAVLSRVPPGNGQHPWSLSGQQHRWHARSVTWHPLPALDTG